MAHYKSALFLLCQLVLLIGSLDLTWADVTVIVDSKSDPVATIRTLLMSPTDSQVDQNKQELENYEKWKKNPMFQLAFVPTVIAVPPGQLQYLRQATEKDFVLYKKILDEAIEGRNRIAATARLLGKYGLRLLTSLISRHREESRIQPRINADPRYFEMIAQLLQDAIAESKELKKGLKKDKIDIEQFRKRTIAVFDYLEKYANVSPYGLYVRLNETRLFMDEEKNERKGKLIKDEGAELAAIFRTIGYESAMGWARRLVNLIKGFASGRQPVNPEEIPE